MKVADNILVSIIIPVYNSEKTIGKCLDSLVGQTYKDIEIICVNDCSQDNSLSVLEQYAAKDKRIVIINHGENKNAGGARNSGIRAAKGEYICFVDNDDWLRLDAIELLVKASDHASYDIVAPQWAIAKADGSTEPQPNLVVGTDREASIRKLIIEGVRMLGVLYRRSMIIENNVFYPERLFWEDNAIYACFFLPSKSIVVIEDVLYYYFIGVQNSSSKSISYIKVRDRVTSTDLLLDNVKLRGFYELYADEFDYRWLSLTTCTLELLTCIRYTDAKPMVEYLQKRISELLPNKYFDKFEPDCQQRLLHPIEYLKRERKKRIRTNIKSFLHSVRHNIVVVVKKLFGMDPTKSIYNK